MESVDQPIIPGLPNDLALRCLAKLSHGYHGVLECVCKRWRNLIHSSDYAFYKAREGWCGDWLFVLTESDNLWVAYDPKADRWHPLPKIPVDLADLEHRDCSNLQHYGFSCVCVSNRLLVIGGSFVQQEFCVRRQRPLVTNSVLQFDPFKKEWKCAAGMRTPRSHFACSVISGKVYVAGGRNLSCPNGVALAEVYDPVTDRWEDLPPMLKPQMDCLGLSYNGKLNILSDHVGLSDIIPSQVFCPSSKTWCTVEDVWPFSKAMQYAVRVMDDGQIYTVVDWGESLIKTKDSEKGEWCDVGFVPSFKLPSHRRAFETFSYGFATLRDELYVLGGKVLEWVEAEDGRFDTMRLRSVRACNPKIRPLKWKEVKPICSPACGPILGCASLEE